MSSSGKPASKAERDLKEVDVVFAALANASRRHILLVLYFRGGEMTAGEIAGRFGCTWPTTTRHLGVLRAAGLIDAEQRGRQRIYSLNRNRFRIATGWLAELTKP